MRYAPQILIVENEPDSLLSFEEALSAIGYSVAVANTAQQALMRLSGQPFDAAIVSLHLPDCDSTALIRQLHSNAPHMPILATSNWLVGTMVEDNLAAGAADVLLKPAPPETVLLRVYRLLDPSERWAGPVVENPSITRVLLALRFLTSGDPGDGNGGAEEDLTELLAYLGDDATGLSSEQIACLVIQREIKRQDEKPL